MPPKKASIHSDARWRALPVYICSTSSCLEEGIALLFLLVDNLEVLVYDRDRKQNAGAAADGS